MVIFFLSVEIKALPESMTAHKKGITGA